MPSYLHEVLVAMFRHRPALAAELLAGPLGWAVPAYSGAALASTEVVELRPTAHRADQVVLLGPPGDPVLAVVVEVQMDVDDDKPWVWPEYLAAVRRRERCPTVLLVVCLKRRTAAWAARPIDLGDGVSRVLPQVLGPSVIPVLREVAADPATPELAVLSALVHVRNTGPFEVLDVLATALDSAPVERALDYARLVLAELPDLARRYLEELMATETFEYESEFTRALEARGEARGRAAMVLRILDLRSLQVDDALRDRVMSCSDLEVLNAWGDAAMQVEHAADIFGAQA